MKRLIEWIEKKGWFVTIPGMGTARRTIREEIGEDIPVYLIKVDKLYIFTDVKPDIKSPGLIVLNNVYVPDYMVDEIIINRDSIDYITEIK